MLYRDDVCDSHEGDDDVDVCVGCGRYYGMTDTIHELWYKSFNYREGAVMPQLCHRCMRGDATPQETDGD